MPVTGEDVVYYMTETLHLNKGHVVDTVGAGDAFVGSFVSSVARNRLITDAMSIASAAGTLACTEPGARPRAIAAAQSRAASVETLCTSTELSTCTTRELFKRFDR